MATQRDFIIIEELLQGVEYIACLWRDSYGRRGGQAPRGESWSSCAARGRLIYAKDWVRFRGVGEGFSGQQPVRRQEKVSEDGVCSGIIADGGRTVAAVEILFSARLI
jgi:hypothetical protein